MRFSLTVSPWRRRAWSAALLGAVLVTPAMASVIDVNNYRFDPLERQPAIPADLRETPIDGQALYLVQFKGPVEESWKEELSSLGAQLHGYIPENAFIVRMDRAASAKAQALPVVRWVGPYHTAYRISPEIGHITFRDQERAGDPLRTLVVYVAQDPFSTAAAAGSLGTVLQMVDDPMLPGFVLHVDPARIAQVAALPEVIWVEEKPETFVQNNTTKWVVQSNVNPQVPIWSHGVYGEGQILCEMDSGLDYNSCWFRDTGNAPPGPTHRKVIDYQTWGGNIYDGCDTGHGTHVAGTAVGDQSFINPGVFDYNGMAYKAKIMMQDVGTDSPGACSNGSVSIPGSLTAAYTDAYTKGARVHTNSWGSSSHSYNGFCVNVDNFMWNHKDFLICFSNGNGGPGGGTVGSPATSKNCVSVGATRQAPSQAIVAGYSSRGPTADGRFKPTVTAPGGETPTYITSANNNPGNPPTATCQTQSFPFEGTSMATPAVAGCALLIRDYFAQGFYPLGLASPSPLLPSAALVKAVLVNSGQEMGAADEPNNNEGWGRVLLNDALYFQGETRELHAEDDNIGLATGEQVTFQYEVDSSAEPLEVSLVWTDYPGTANANPELVNDLDLTVVSPTSITYRGNVYSGGQSITGGSADRLNVEETVRRATPEVGIWTVTVRAQNVPQGGLQPFAVVTTGSFANWPILPAAAPEATVASRILLEPAQPNPFNGQTSLTFSLPSAGDASLSIFDTAGRRVATLASGWLEAGSHRYDWDGRFEDGTSAPSGTYFSRLQAGKTTVTRKIARLR